MSDRRLKILSIFGTRPEVIKMYPVLERLEAKDDAFQSIIVTTSQHREMIEDLLELFDITPDHDLNIIRENQTLMDISTRAMRGLDPLLGRHRPDLVLVQGDTTTAFIGALAAFYHKIPVGHVEAGLRSFDKFHPFPEEVNRRLISLVSDLHFAPTWRNAENLKAEGVAQAGIYVTGNTVIDALLHVARKNRRTLETYVPHEILDAHRLILVTSHRRESWGASLENLCHGLLDLVRRHPDIVVLYPVHLNPNVRETVFPILDGKDRILLLDPLPYEPFIEAMARSYLIITDSGGIQEEGPSLKKPVLVFRKVTERPEGIEGGGVKLVGLERETMVAEASRLLDDPAAYGEMATGRNPYGDGHAAERIVRAIRHHFLGEKRPGNFVSFHDRDEAAEPL